MQRKTLAALILCLPVLGSTIARVDTVTGPVGPLGDPARLDFTGNLPASPERLRFLLGGDVELSLAAAPDKPLADYLTTLDRRLRVALSSAGWPRPAVTVDAAARPGRVAVGSTPAPADIRAAPT